MWTDRQNYVKALELGLISWDMPSVDIHVDNGGKIPHLSTDIDVEASIPKKTHELSTELSTFPQVEVDGCIPLPEGQHAE